MTISSSSDHNDPRIIAFSPGFCLTTEEETETATTWLVSGGIVDWLSGAFVVVRISPFNVVVGKPSFISLEVVKSS